MQKAQRLTELVEKANDMDSHIWNRMSDSVKVVVGKAKLGLLTVLMFVLRWPDWQLTSLYTKGFTLAGLVEHFNTYPKVECKGEGILHDLLETDWADEWNSKLEMDTKAFDHDTDVWDISQDQRRRQLLSGAMTKKQTDAVFGEGRWRGIRRRGIWQNDKVRGIDNARTSGTIFAAWLQDTIMTTPHNIGIQILCWLFNGKDAEARFDAKFSYGLWVANVPAMFLSCLAYVFYKKKKKQKKRFAVS